MHSDSVLKLGEKIVDELGLDQTVDTLGRWMAHYISEKIEDAETATGEDRDQKMSVCADAILNLWAHRREFERGKRPFEDFEPIFRALQSLDPENTTPRYFLQAMSAAGKDEESSETAGWLSCADEIDTTAKLLIRYCLAVAAETSLDKSKEWVGLVNAVGNGEDSDVYVVKILLRDADKLTPKTQEDIDREKIEDFVDKLDTFVEMANKLSEHFSGLLSKR